MGFGAPLRGGPVCSSFAGRARSAKALTRAGALAPGVDVTPEVRIQRQRNGRRVGEGNFVLVVSEGSFAGNPTAFYELFRVDSGKLAEHWDTVEAIPPKDQWKNGNGKF